MVLGLDTSIELDHISLTVSAPSAKLADPLIGVPPPDIGPTAANARLR